MSTITSHQSDHARQFHSLHQPSQPLVLFNSWDAGSSVAIERAGARAIATGSHSVAQAQGYDDGEALPFIALLQVARQIISAVELPVSIDFESGYAEDITTLKDNIRALIKTGVVGINLEDQWIGQGGIRSTDDQSDRIAAIRSTADDAGMPLFINARTDLFLQQSDPSQHASLIDAAIERATAYRDAGASGLFVPGLCKPELIRAICSQSPMPVNIMMMPNCPSPSALSELGVARISHGPGPWRQAMATLTGQARAAFAP
jgi:2-methylisocitrate lyase-like PEP mutase family enzyme